MCCIEFIGLRCSGLFKTKGHREVPLALIWPQLPFAGFLLAFAPEQLEF
jgi:hypothetical protein